jgi:LacI family transcriptional regulator
LTKSLPILVHLRWNFQFAQDVIGGLLAYETNPHLELSVADGNRALTVKEVATLSPKVIVGDSHYRNSIEICAKRNIPFIDLTGSGNVTGLHQILPDDTKIGQMAADYLRAAGFVNFAFAGYSDQAYSERREEGFRRAINPMEAASYKSSLSPYLMGDKDQDLEEFLQALPQPCGIFACSDLRAMAVHSALKHLNKRIPEDIAILGVDVDHVLRRISGQQIPSIDQGAWFQGWQAGLLADRLAKDSTIPAETLRMRPIQVVDFEKLQIVNQMDPVIRIFMAALNENYAFPDGLVRALKEVPLSRRSIESLTRKRLGASPLQLLHRTRLKSALTLLAKATLPLSEVAHKVGFENQGDFSRFIKKAVGVPPGVVRRGLLSKTT